MIIAENLIEERARVSLSQSRDKPVRSFAKAISWRITGTLDTMIISWFFTSSIDTAIAIGSTEVLTKTLLYYFHERAWSRVRLGTGSCE